jgi:hypothetical protein
MDSCAHTAAASAFPANAIKGSVSLVGLLIPWRIETPEMYVSNY